MIMRALLIGVNCMKALEEIQVIKSENDCLYDYIIRLGWWIVEPIANGDSEVLMSCHWATVRNASTSQAATHHFGIKDFIKDITVEYMLMILVSSSSSKQNLMSSNEVSVGG